MQPLRVLAKLEALFYLYRCRWAKRTAKQVDLSGSAHKISGIGSPLVQFASCGPKGQEHALLGCTCCPSLSAEASLLSGVPPSSSSSG